MDLSVNGTLEWDQAALLIAGGTESVANQMLENRAPTPQVIGLYPRPWQMPGRVTLYSDLLMLATYIQFTGALTECKERSSQDFIPVKNPADVAHAYTDMADAFATACSSLENVGILTPFYQSTNTIGSNISRKDAHAKLLAYLFDWISLDDGAEQALDTVLTNFASAVKDYKVDENEDYPGVKQSIAVLYVKNVSLDATGSISVPTAFLRWVILDIKTSSWNAALPAKKSTSGSFLLNMDIIVQEYSLSVENFDSFVPKLEELWSTVVQQLPQKFEKTTMAEFGAELTKLVEVNDLDNSSQGEIKQAP